MIPKTVLLAGSGHAHLEVIREMPQELVAKHRFILVSPSTKTYYSGLIPKLISNEIGAKQLTIESAAYAKSKGFEFIKSSVESIDEKRNNITLQNGENLNFDILSLNIGGTPQDIKTSCPLTTVHLRPFDNFIEGLERINKAVESIKKPRFIVVGGGPAGVEVAVALKTRFNKNQKLGAEICIVTEGERLCATYSESISKKILSAINSIGIAVNFNESTEIFDQYILLKNGNKLEFDFILIVTPTKPSPLLLKPIDNSLRIAANIFAVGDCAKMQNYSKLPRSGVTAVHQGRHLAQSIGQLLEGSSPKDFKPNKNSLNILITGEEVARAVWGTSCSFESKLLFKIKNWIDANYMQKFSESLPTSPKSVTQI
ncbi:MAG: FAD-dependent oxidoreductase [Pseudobdellovibrio sp.]